MANEMLIDIAEELNDKFPNEGRVQFSDLNTLYLAARSSHMKRFVEALNTINSTNIQTYLVNTVSVCVCMYVSLSPSHYPSSTNIRQVVNFFCVMSAN